MGSRRQNIQLVASLLLAALLVAVTIAVVTAEFGPTPATELELQEERIKQREDLREERLDLREERLKDR